MPTKLTLALATVHTGGSVVKIFDFDPTEYAEAYRAKHWVHVKNGISKEFLGVISGYATATYDAVRLRGEGLRGEKNQYLFEFPDEVDFPGEVFDAVSIVCDLKRDSMVLSERHIKAYEQDADPDPVAHKDRLASQVSMGLSISIPEKSRLVLYPYRDLDVNPFLGPYLRSSLPPHKQPEVILQGAREVEIDDSNGDVVLFPGSSFWHLRRRSAGAINLYLKMNDFGCDPLAEDPSTEPARVRSLELIERSDEQLQEMIPVLSRRLDSVSREYTRNRWRAVTTVRVWGEERFGVTDKQNRLIRSVDGRSKIYDLARDAALPYDGTEDLISDVRWLVQRGAIDLAERVR